MTVPRCLCPIVIGVAVLAALVGCAPQPYQATAEVTPPWEMAESPELPGLDPPFSARAHRLHLCYGQMVNDQEEVREAAAELCQGGRLLVEHQNTFWNGCSVLQPVRVTYICDPPEPPPSDYQ